MAHGLLMGHRYHRNNTMVFIVWTYALHHAWFLLHMRKICVQVSGLPKILRGISDCGIWNAEFTAVNLLHRRKIFAVIMAGAKYFRAATESQSQWVGRDPRMW